MFHQVGLGHQTMAAADGRNGRQHVIAHHVGQGAVTREYRRSGRPGVGPAAAAQESEGRVDLSGQNEPVQPAAETAAAYRPVFQVHFFLHPGNHSNDGCANDKDENNAESNCFVLHASRHSFVR